VWLFIALQGLFILLQGIFAKIIYSAAGNICKDHLFLKRVAV